MCAHPGSSILLSHNHVKVTWSDQRATRAQGFAGDTLAHR